ncbi:MAG: DUF11 domain-containing protein [Pseudomonadota bacterium]
MERTAALLLAVILLSLLGSGNAYATRPLTVRYTKNTNGDVKIIGNAVMTCNPAGPTGGGTCAAARNGTAGVLADNNNNNHTMMYIDVDSDSSTFSSSTANLSLEGGSSILWAGLYWGGDQTAVTASRGQCLFQTPGSFGYTSILANQVDQDGSNPIRYQSYANVTDLVRSAGSGSYSVANVVSRSGSTNTFGGWSLVVVYGNNSLPLRNLTVFDGYQVIPAAQTLTISGFLSPLSGQITTRVGVMAYEGDLGLLGDYLQLNGTTISDAVHPSDNFFNSSITEQGVYVAARSPSYINNLGFDLSRTNIPNGIIKNGDTSASITLNTNTDQYYPSVVTFATDLYVPIVTPNVVKTAARVPSGTSVTAGDTIRYTISMKNTGFDTAANLILVDPIPAYTTYKPGSLQILTGSNSGVKSDTTDSDQAEFVASGTPRVVFRLGSGASAGSETTGGGDLVYNDATSLSFDVTVNPGIPAGTLLTNTAGVSYRGQTLGTTFATSSAAVSMPVMTAPQVSKALSPNPINVNGSSTLKIVVSNPSTNPAVMSGVTFTDSYPAGMINSATPTPTLNCTAGSVPGSLTGGVAGGGDIGLTSTSIPAGGSCTVSVNVTSATAGNYTNSVTVESGNAGSSTPASATLSVGTPAVVLKAFTPAVIQSGGTSSISFLLSNPTGSTLTGVSFSDTLANMAISTTGVAGGDCVGVGSNSFAAGQTGLVTISGITMAPNSTCTATISVASSTTGVHPNQTSGVTSNQNAVAGILSNIAYLTVVGAPEASKSFSPESVRPNVASRLSITVDNPNTTTTLTGVSFTDSYPTTPGTMRNSTPASATLSCTDGSTATRAGGTDGGTTLGISAATLAPGGSCTVSANVQSSTASTTLYTNSTGAITSPDSGPGVAATAQLLVTNNAVPTSAKAFSPTTIKVNETSTLTITLSNSNAVAITGAALCDNYPYGMINAAVPNAATSCVGGTVNAVAGGDGLTLEGATIPARGSCTITVDVTSATAGSFYNTTGPVGTANAGSGVAASATLTVVAPPSITKSFVANPISVGGTSQLRIVVSNPAANTSSLTGVSFTDSYPAGLVNTSSASPTLSCASGSSATRTGGANNGTTIGISSGTLAVNGSCTLTVNVTSAASGSYLNSVTANSTNGGIGDAATATLSVGQPGINKAFSPAIITNGQTSTLTITLLNPTGSPMTSAAFTDNYLPGTISNVGTPSTTCAGGTATGTIGGAFVGLSGGTIPANGSCTVSVLVTAASSVVNTIPAGALTVSGGTSNVNPASATLNMTPPPAAIKEFLPSVIPQGGTSTLTITLSNANSTSATGVAFTDSYPASLVNAGTPGVVNTCGGVVTASGGGGSLALTGGSIPGNSSCSVSVNVTGSTVGTFTNHTGAIATGNMGSGSDTTAQLIVMAPPGFAKSFSPDKILLNGTSTLTISLSNSNPAPITGVAFTDPYPAGLVNAATPLASTNCGGTLTAAAGGNSLVLTGGTIPANGNCLASVQVTSAATGVYSNPASPFSISTSNAGSSQSVAATLSVLATPTVVKSFTPDTIRNFETSTLTLTLTNPNVISGLTGVGISDSFPAGLYVATGTPTTTCGGTLTGATQGSATVVLNGAALPQSGSCTVTIPVTSGQPGVYENTSSGVSSNETGGPATASNTVTLTVEANYGAVSGSVYSDVNHNGSMESGETGTGQALYLKLTPRAGDVCNGPAIQYAIADPATGSFSFDSPAAGDYCVLLSTNTTLSDLNPTVPSGWLPLEIPGGIRKITLLSNPMSGQNFGLFNGSVISGRVFSDTGTGGGGIANNGIQDGSEPGLGSSALKVTDSGGGTIYDSTTSAASGDFTLWIPAAAGAATLKIVETNPADHLSTGGLAGTTGGSYDRTTDILTFSNIVGTSYSAITFADVPDNRLLTDNTQSALAGSVLYHPHVFTASSGGSVVFSSAAIPSPVIPGWSEVIYRDLNCNATFDSGEPQLSGPLSVLAGEQVCILVKEFVPAGAPQGATNQVSVTAAFTFTNAPAPVLTRDYFRGDITTVGNPSSAGLTLNKTVDKASALPGESLIYTINYSNNSSESLKSIVIHDSVPSFTVSPLACCVNPSTSCLGSATTPFPADISGCSATISGSSIDWTMTGTLAPGSTGQVKFQVIIQP